MGNQWGPYIHLPADELLRDRQAGMSQALMAKKWGVRPNVIYRHLKKAGYVSDRLQKYGMAKKYFYETVIAYSCDDCLMWPYSRNEWGYGIINIGKRCLAVHRLACIEVHGEAPTDRHQAAHSCGNGHLGCVNPRHLRWATPLENKADELIHGTRNRGERSGSAKLCDADVRQIRALASSKLCRELAKDFGVTSGTVSAIITRKIWSHVE